jgi:peroxiredoxin Q/BCP
VRDEIELFRQAGVQPLGVNPASAESHTKYATKLGLGFPLLSDPDRAIARAYHAVKDDGKGIQRTVYGIGRDGAIVFAARGAPPPAEIAAAFTP